MIAVGAGTIVLVEKPVVIDPAAIGSLQAGDERIFVAFQSHFAPGIAELLAAPVPVRAAEVVLRCHHDESYFRQWRRSWATAGGILHQQAIHGLALATRLFDGPVVDVVGGVHCRRGLAEMEDRITASVRLRGGREIVIDARIDDDGSARHHVVLHTESGGRAVVRGRNLEAGFSEPTMVPSHHDLQVCMYRAALDTVGQTMHSSLFPLSVPHLLGVITRIYGEVTPPRTVSAAASGS